MKQSKNDLLNNIPSRWQCELEDNIKFFGLIFQEIDDYNSIYKKHILIAFKRTRLTLHRFQFLHPKVIRKIRRLNYKFGLDDNIVKYDERYD